MDGVRPFAGRRTRSRTVRLSSILRDDGQRGTPNVAIIGGPNVGKSALFNRLVGRKIAIVHDQARITRDRLRQCTRTERPFNVWDTGGILARRNGLTAQSVTRRGSFARMRSSSVW